MREMRQLALAVGSLLRKGYFSTVGAVKVDGAISLPRADADAAATADAATADAATADCEREVRRRLGEAAEAVSSDWWVPASYERLLPIVTRCVRCVRALRARKERERSLPIVTREELRSAVEVDGHASLCRLCSDPLLMQRAIDYLEAVGDAMSDRRLDVLLLDPVGWFAAFLAHFVRDDGNLCADVVRGVVALPDIVAALQHGYSAPEAQLNEVMSLVCSLELCVELSRLEKDAAGCGRFLFPCLLPLVSAPELACHWPAAEATATPLAALVMRGHRFRARDRFLPPGVFPMLVARLARLPAGSVSATRLWRDAAVVRFRAASALLRVDLAAATLDIVVAAPNDAYHFVGAAKGQASAVRWLAHLVRQMLARGYPSITFDEAWLCPTPSCHGVPCGGGDGDEGAPVAGAAADRDFGTYCGTEFPLEPTAAKPGHACEHEGCWNFLGTGHRLEPLQLRAAAAGAEAPAVCASCGQQPYFPLRAGGGFGWAAKEDAELLRGGMSVAQPRVGIGCKVGELHEDVGRDTKRLGS